MKRKNGEGTWGKKNIKGVEYNFYRNPDGKYFYGKTIKDVNDKLKKYNKEAPVSKSSQTITLYNYLTNYLSEKRNQIESTTYDNYEDALKCHVEPSIVGNKQLHNITAKDLTNFANQLAEEYSKATIDKIFRIIKPALRKAYKNGDINKDIVSDILIPTERHVAVKKKKVPFIIESDLDKLYKESKRVNEKGNACGKIGDYTYGSNAYAVLLLAHTGLRASELRGLKWADIDLKNKKLKVNGSLVNVRNRNNKTNELSNKYINEFKTPKTKTSVREIPLSDVAIEMINNYDKLHPNHKQSDFVVLNKNGNSPSNRNISRTLDCMLKRSGCSIEHCGLHGLRHGFGAILLTNGVDIKIVSKLLGHKDITTTYNIYIDFTAEQVENAVIDVFNKK